MLGYFLDLKGARAALISETLTERDGLKDMERHSTGISARSFVPLVELVMSDQAFSAHWSQCDSIAAYFARAIGHNRTDSTLYSSLFSSALNELLEIAYRNQRSPGVVVCKVSRREDADRIEISIPCETSEGRSLLRAVEQLSGPGSEARYMAALTSKEGESPDIGLLELAHDYNANISANSEADGKITLIIDLRLEQSVLP